MISDPLFKALSIIIPVVFLFFWRCLGIGFWQCVAAWLNVQGTLFLAYSVELQHDNETAKGMFQPALLNGERLILGIICIVVSTIVGLLTPVLFK